MRGTYARRRTQGQRKCSSFRLFGEESGGEGRGRPNTEPPPQRAGTLLGRTPLVFGCGVDVAEKVLPRATMLLANDGLRPSMKEADDDAEVKEEADEKGSAPASSSSFGSGVSDSTPQLL